MRSNDLEHHNLSPIVRLLGKRWDILERLYEHSYSASELSKELDKTLSWTSSQLNELRKAELVDFEKRADKRFKQYSLTHKGRRIYSAFVEALRPAPKGVVKDSVEVDILLDQLERWEAREKRGETMPPDFRETMHGRLVRIANVNPAQCLRMANYFLNRLKADEELTSSHRRVFIMLRRLVPISEEVKGRLEGEAGRLKDLALGWLRRAKEDPRSDEVDHSRDAYLEALRLIQIVFEGREKKEFFINLFKESIGPPDLTVGEISSYWWPLRFIEDKADLLRELIEIAGEERDDEKRRRILEVIRSFDSYATVH